MVAWESVHSREEGDSGLLRSNPASIEELCGRSLDALSTVSFPVFSNCSLQAGGVAPGSDANPGSSVPTGSRVLTFSAACGSPAPGNSSKLMSWKHCGISRVLQEYPWYLLNLSKLSTVRFFSPKCKEISLLSKQWYTFVLLTEMCVFPHPIPLSPRVMGGCGEMGEHSLGHAASVALLYSWVRLCPREWV